MAKNDETVASEKGSELTRVVGSSWFQEARELLQALFMAVGIAILLRFFVMEAFKIPSGSMLPTLEIGDYLFVNKFKYGLMIPLTTQKVLPSGGGVPERGDIVVFKYPPDISQDFIKRVIGLPGDLVQMRDGVLTVTPPKGDRMTFDQTGGTDRTVVDSECYSSGGLMKEESIPGRTHALFQSGGRLSGFDPVQVEPGHVFVIGDNRNNSSDSRAWGQVPVQNIKGKAMFIWMSLDACAFQSCFGLNHTERDLGRCVEVVRWGRLFDGVH